MNIKLLLLNILCVNCNLILYKSVKTLKINNETVVLSEIISNYLFTFFHNEKMSVSIVMSSSSSNIHQSYLHEDLVENLMLDLNASNFSFNVLSNIDQSRLGNKNVFNLIVVDDINSLK